MCRTCGKRHNSYDMGPSSNGPHDVSLEPAGSIPFSLGLRSPGKTSPLRGRNMKDYEEQLEHLKKENFALKLRIYFLEERMGNKGGGGGAKEDKDELNKANIELKVETEALKKELCDKQELVRQAAALLTSLESQFKERLHEAHEKHRKETQELKATIAALQKDVDDFSERGGGGGRCRHEEEEEGGISDLTRLCGLAFSSSSSAAAAAEDDEEDDDDAFSSSSSPSHRRCPRRTHDDDALGRARPAASPSHLQGIFSLREEGPRSPPRGEGPCHPLSPTDAPHQYPLAWGAADPDDGGAQRRKICALEAEVERLSRKVEALQETLQHKEAASHALQQDVDNLKKEMEDREEKLSDMELEVVEKEEKVDQLMQELETRHHEIEAKDSTIQTLHNDLNKVEPQIEVKVQELREKDRVIEAKSGQLEEQNKILVEIQITLDEKQKQIAELEDKVEKLEKEVTFSVKIIGEMTTEIRTRDKEVSQLKKEVKRKEKKVKDLLAELKEALDMLKAAKSEAEGRGEEGEGQAGVTKDIGEEPSPSPPPRLREEWEEDEELREKDRVIEAKSGQLEEQNKILVEIQITLDEKQKQISELEDALSAATLKGDKLEKEFTFSMKTIVEMATEIRTRDKDICQLKKEVKRKEKKVKDLLAELKEALDMLKKAKWEAETSGGQDGVKEMVEDENERLWAELEQKKLEMKTLQLEREEALRRQREEHEERVRALQKQLEGGERKEREEEEEQKESKGDEEEEEELASLRKMMESRDALLRGQEVAIGTLKAELSKAEKELTERKDELKHLNKELSTKNLDMQDLFTKELFGRSKEVKDLQDKLCALSSGGQGANSPLEMLKLVLEANRKTFSPEMFVLPSKASPPPPSQHQVRSNSLSQLSEQETVASPDEGRESCSPRSAPKPGRSSSLSRLENALYAQMGQKVVNTNQTFNTYVLSGGGGERKPREDGKAAIATEEEEEQHQQPRELTTSHEGLSHAESAKAFLADILIKEIGKNTAPSSPFKKSHAAPSQREVEVEFCSVAPSVDMSEDALQLLYQEVSSIRSETQALRKDREILSEKVCALQRLNEQLSSDAVTQGKSRTQQPQLESLLTLQLEGSREEKSAEDQSRDDEVVSVYKGQNEALKRELKGLKRKVTLQVLQAVSAKYQESLKNYKQEIISLRKRLADSHNACDLLRNRLEELVDFLEQILDMDKRGLIDLSHLSSAQRASLQKSLDDSRSLSHSLSHSLMIGTDSLLADNTLSTLNEEAASMFFLPSDHNSALADELDISQPQDENTYASLSHLDLDWDPTSDTLSQSAFASKLHSHLDSKSIQEIDDLATAKLSHLSDVLESKDEQLKRQTDALINLESQIANLQEELQVKDQLLLETKALTAQTPFKDYAPNASQNITNSSLHLSNLQHSFPLPPFDSNLHEGIFATPGECSSSDTLPPPPPPPQYLSSQDDCIHFQSSDTHCGAVDDSLKQPVPSQSDVPSAYSTDILVKSLPRLSEPPPSISRSDLSRVPPSPSRPSAAATTTTTTTTTTMTTTTPMTPRMLSLDHPSLPPSLAVASPSESEAWSEPDRNVSLARIGLEACNLVSLSHDRSLSRSRMTRSAPFTSESDGEGNPEDATAKEGSNGLGTPGNKAKRRSDAAEAKRLASKLRAVEQLNETLRAELNIYQTIGDQFNGSLGVAREKSTQMSDHEKKFKSDAKGTTGFLEEADAGSHHKNSLSADGNGSSPFVPSPSLLQEIRSLRMKLEEAIANNDLLRDQLEAALSGYLSEETRSLATKLAAAQHELKINQDNLLAAADTEEQLKGQIKENEAKMFDLGERLADYMTCNQKLEKTIQDLNENLKELREALQRTEEELNAVAASKEEKEWAREEGRESKCFQLEMELSSLQVEVNKMQLESDAKMDEQQKYILCLEESKADYESRLSEQDAAINELCQSITKLQQESCSVPSASDELVSKLQDALQSSEERVLEVTKERFALVGERARLQAQLASVTTHAKLLLQRGGGGTHEGAEAEGNWITAETEAKQLLQRLKASQSAIFELQKDKKLLVSEKQATQKEMQLLQEEISALRAHLDHVLSREAVTNSREVRELASLQMKYSNLREEHSSLENNYKISLLEKNCVEAKLKEEKEILELKTILKETDLNKAEVLSQLEAERRLTANLQVQIKSLHVAAAAAKPPYPKVPSDYDSGSTNAATSPDLIRPRGGQKQQLSPLSKMEGRRTVHHCPLKRSWWTAEEEEEEENKENRVPHSSSSFVCRYCRGTSSLPRHSGAPLSPSEGDDGGGVTSGASPDLGIGSSDGGGHFSSLERLRGGGGGGGGGGRREVTTEAERTTRKAEGVAKKEERNWTLCSEPSHSQLFSEIKRLREERERLLEERESLSTRLCSTRESLDEALCQLSRATRKKESVERAICRQLSKTHDVLRRAKGNLRHANDGARTQMQMEGAASSSSSSSLSSSSSSAEPPGNPHRPHQTAG